MNHKPPEIYEGIFVSDESPVFHLSPAIGVEVTKEQRPISILRIKRVYNKIPINFWFKSPKKIKNYVPVRIRVEYL